MINRTLRNWTILPSPNFDKKCILDQCGSITLGKDGFSISIALKVGERFELPSKSNVQIDYNGDNNEFSIDYNDFGEQNVSVYVKKGIYIINSKLDFKNFLVVVRPFNPEGVSPIFSLEMRRNDLFINGNRTIEFGNIKRSFMSNYKEGDVLTNLNNGDLNETKEIHCDYGFCTGAFEIETDSYSIYPIKYKKVLVAKKFVFNWKESFNFTLNDERMLNVFKVQRNYLSSFCSQSNVVSGAFTDNEVNINDHTYLLPALDAIGKRKEVELYLSKINIKDLEIKDLGKYVWLLLDHYLLSKDRPFIDKYKEKIYLILKKINEIRVKNHNFLLPQSKGTYEFSSTRKYIQDDLWALSAYKLACMVFDDDSRLKRHYLSYLTALREELKDHFKKTGKEIFFKDSIEDFSLLVYPELIYDYMEPVIANSIEYTKNTFLKDKIFYNKQLQGYDILSTLKYIQVLMIKNDNEAMDIFDRILNYSDETLSFPKAINPLTLGGVVGDGHYSPITAQMINFIANIFGYDKLDGELHIFKVSKYTWFEDNISVKNLPTRYGILNYELKVKDYYDFQFIIEPVKADIFLHLPFEVIVNESGKTTKVLRIQEGVTKFRRV